MICLKSALRKILGIVLSCAVTVGCGYHLRGTGSFLPAHIKKISIPMFKNETTRYELDLKLTQSVINELVARAKLEISADSQGADAVLSGDITAFNVNPIAFSGQATADRYNIIIVAKVVLRDLVNQRVIFSNPSFSYTQEYEVPQGTDFESIETLAIDIVAEKFARSLVVNILEGF
jgi:outer membrane lipopolysaccharide assembly protein LptE/RlpB